MCRRSRRCHSCRQAKAVADILGIFDSGLGGLTVLRAVRERLPGEDILYYADQAHVPYGDRSNAELTVLLAHNVAYLEACGVDAIVMGCNTSCAVASERGWPASRVPILDLIDAAAAEVAASGARRVGVVATAATVRSGAYARAIRRHDCTIDVQEVAAPRLVPLVESGVLSGPVARAAVTEVSAGFAGRLDALVLGCTHYPLLAAEFTVVLDGVTQHDPAQAQARRVDGMLRERARRISGTTRYVTTGAVEPYRRAVESIVGSAGENDAFAFAPPFALRDVHASIGR